MDVQADSKPVWQQEFLHDRIGVRFSFKADKVLVEEKTDFQHLVLFENKAFGTVLMLDGGTQLTTADEFVYHEMMSHVPLFALDAPQDVLIIGGGDGGIAREVLKHSSVRHVSMVEIDDGVVVFSKQHLPSVSNGAFDDPRFELVIEDGMKFVAETEKRFDAILVDSTDPVGPAAVLFTQEFYAGCKRCLKPGGVMVTQSGSPFFQGDELTGCVEKFRTLFKDGSAYVAATPTYVGGFFALGWASDDEALRSVSIETLERRFAGAGMTTKYYSPAVHKAAFALPPYVGKLLP